MFIKVEGWSWATSLDLVALGKTCVNRACLPLQTGLDHLQHPCFIPLWRMGQRARGRGGPGPSPGCSSSSATKILQPAAEGRDAATARVTITTGRWAPPLKAINKLKPPLPLALSLPPSITQEKLSGKQSKEELVGFLNL